VPKKSITVEKKECILKALEVVAEGKGGEVDEGVDE
jgi:hypothetical protein